MRYLLAAEADKIQDFIFRSSRLREVVGASQLLTRFCRDDDGVKELLQHHGGNPQQDICVNDGGSFRIFFDDADRARQFGVDLAELYRLSLGTSIAVAEPVPADNDFKTANEEANTALRRAKNQRQRTTAEVHLPYMAFCASCGVGLADKHGRLAGESRDVPERYLCRNCQIKSEERQKRTVFLDEFLELAIDSNEHVGQFTWPEDADAVARYDLRQRNYVGYIVADGNGMGKLFGKCTEAQIDQLSTSLTEKLRASLAAPTKQLLGNLQLQKNDDGLRIVPVLPLILGGDDLFALIPAPYALDFAYRFCQKWEQQLATLLTSEEVGFQIGDGEGKIPRPTIAAAVVICKSKYPYALAHARADALLKEAKRQSKLLAAETGQQLSTVNFEVILGNRLAGLDEDDATEEIVVRPSLRPCWVVPEGGELPAEHGIDLKILIDQRFQLKDVPNKRLNELRRRFEELPDQMTVINRNERLAKWTKTLEPIIKRSNKAKILQQAMATLGQPLDAQQQLQHNWREHKRGDNTVKAHGLLDLLEVWDFAQDLSKYPEQYEAEEDET